MAHSLSHHLVTETALDTSLDLQRVAEAPPGSGLYTIGLPFDMDLTDVAVAYVTADPTSVTRSTLNANYAMHGEGGVVESPPGSGLFVSTIPSDELTADTLVSDIVSNPASLTRAAIATINVIAYDTDGVPYLTI